MWPTRVTFFGQILVKSRVQRHQCFVTGHISHQWTLLPCMTRETQQQLWRCNLQAGRPHPCSELSARSHAPVSGVSTTPRRTYEPPGLSRLSAHPETVSDSNTVQYNTSLNNSWQRAAGDTGMKYIKAQRLHNSSSSSSSSRCYKLKRSTCVNRHVLLRTAKFYCP